jgi:NADH-quinone oxidoreductase subunit L
MAIATLAISGVPPLSGFFSKDAILGATFARASGSPLASASLLGIPGSTVLYAAYVIGIITALLTAVYMTRMLLLAFFGENRTGQEEQHALHETPAVMTGPVLVLAVLALVGGWLNLPALMPLGRVGALEHWLDPVTGASAIRLAGTGEVAHDTEWMLIGAAVAISILGIAYALVRYRGLQPDKAHASAETGFAGVLAHAYNVDAALDATVVRPVNVVADSVLTRGVDVGVDRAFSASGNLLTRTAAAVGRQLQDGDVGKYAWLLAAGALVMLAALTLR